MNIERVWVCPSTSDMCSVISIRFDTSKEVTGISNMFINQDVFPPRNMNLEDARKQNKQQDHITLGVFSDEELLKIRDAIEVYLKII